MNRLRPVLQLLLGSLLACAFTGCSAFNQPMLPSSLPPDEAAFSVPSDWKEYHSDVLRLTFAYPPDWAIQTKDNYISLSSPDRFTDAELIYSIFIGERLNPEHRSFSDVAIEGLSEEWVRSFKFTSIQIGDYLTYQTESLPSQSGALEVFIDNGERYMEFGLTPYSSQNPFPGQIKHEKLFEELLKTVRLTE